MAIVKECILLANVKQSSLLGITSGLAVSHVILTERCRISIYNLADQKLVCDWLVKTDQKVLCPAVELVADSHYAVVINDNVYRSWSRNAVAIDKEHKQKLNSTVFKLFVINKHVVYLYQDGSLKTEHASLYEADKDTSSWIVWADICGIDNDVNYIVVVSRDKTRSKQEQYYVRTYSWNSDVVSAVVNEISLHCSSKNVYPVGYCLQADGYSVDLISQNIGGKLIRTRLVAADGNRYTELLSPLCEHNYKRCLAIAAIDASQIAVIGFINDDTSKVGVGIWDTKFGVYHSWTPLPDEKLVYGQMYYMKDNLLVACENAVYVIPVLLKSSTLSSCLGKTIVATKSCILENIAHDVISAFKQLSNVSQTDSYSKFKKSFSVVHNWIKQHKTAVVSEAKLVDDSLAVQPLVQSVLHRCIQETQFWPITEIKELIVARLVPTSVCTQLCRVLAEHNEIGVLLCCMLYITDLPESALVTCLACYLTADDSKFTDIESVAEIGDCCATLSNSEMFSSQRAFCIDAVLSMSYNDAFLVDALHQLNCQQVLLLMQYLKNILQTTSITTSSVSHLSVLKVIDWISLLIDAHYTQIALSPDTVELHDQLQKAVKLQYEDLQLMNDIDNRLSCILRGKTASKPDIGSYCIATLRI